jgi:hypothetical protein
MKNRTNPPTTQRKNRQYAFTPLITTVAFPLFIGRQKNAESTQGKSLKYKKPKSKSLAIAKYEVSDNKIKFFDAKGFPKKRWVLIKEISIQEISAVESFGNELKLKCNEEIFTFFFKKNSETVISLTDQIQSLLKEQMKALEKKRKIILQKKWLNQSNGCY